VYTYYVGTCWAPDICKYDGKYYIYFTVAHKGNFVGKQNVLRSRAERKIEMPFLQAGKHTLKIYAVDCSPNKNLLWKVKKK
jgi:beta-xylosidase